MIKKNVGCSSGSTPDIDELISKIREEGNPPPVVPAKSRLALGEIMHRVRAEVARRQGQTTASSCATDQMTPELAERAGQHGGEFVRWRSTAVPNVTKREFTLPELLAASDETFVSTAYRAVLRREPEQEGIDHYLGMLRSGRLSKVEILAELRWSHEGKARSVHVDGLLAPYLLQKWRRKPVIGPVISWVQSLLRLGAFSERQQLLDAAAAREAHGLGSLINHLSRQLQTKFEELETIRLRQEHAVSDKIIALQEQFEQRLSGFEQSGENHLRALRTQISDLQSQLGTRESTDALVDLRVSQLALAVDKHVSETRSNFASGKETSEQHLSSLQADIEALDNHVSAAHSIFALDKTTVEQRLSALQDKVETLSGALGSIQEEVEPRLTQVQAALARAEELVTAKLESQQSQLEILRPFPAGLMAVQQSLTSLVEQQATASAQLKELAGFEQRIESLRRRLHERLDHVQVGLDAEREQLVRQSQQVSVQGAELEAHRAELQGHGAVLSLIEQGKANDLSSARALDPLYVAFEDQFRGTRDLVRARAEPYFELVRDAGFGTAGAPVLDVGCGRGEWLELLRERGLVGRGVDSNRVFLDLCRGRGLDVIEGDVIEVMRSLPEGSFGAVTGMHIAEHLPFDVLIQLLDEARRLLKPNGLLALETPNPENLEVASHFFYMDPTHRNPLPPEAFRWMVEARGFDQARIERWTVARDMGAPPLLDSDIPGADSVNVLLSKLAMAPDYSIIARRGSM